MFDQISDRVLAEILSACALCAQNIAQDDSKTFTEAWSRTIFYIPKLIVHDTSSSTAKWKEILMKVHNST